MRLRLWLPRLLGFTAYLVVPLALPASAQTSSPAAAVAPGPTAYDAVSIHEHDPNNANKRWRTLPDGITMVNVTLQFLASSAYGVKLDLVTGGPAWVSEKGFDLTAKALPGEDGKPRQLTSEQHSALLRQLLLDRFHLQAHVDSKILPVYDLVLAKGGIKMQVAPAPPPPPESPTVLPDLSKRPRGLAEFGPGYLRATSYALSGVADYLGNALGKTVVDNTGLTGFYDLNLEFTPPDQPAHAAQGNGPDPKPDLFTAVGEQLGLKLTPTKGPVRTLVIDHAELPTPN